jgi:beta-galactosidase GanA
MIRHLSASLLATAILMTGTVQAQTSLPQLVSRDSHHALLVDGAPFLILGAQANNSSNAPAQLPMVWAAIDRMGANTLEMPVAWEQIEPREGQFDFSWVDTLLGEARQHHVRLIPLWFATWKNGSPHYSPEWVKTDPIRFPRVVGAKGEPVDSLSPLGAATLKADSTAFAALMAHLKIVDPQHNVIMVQVENETGTWGSVRDYSPLAQKAFDGQVPAALLKARNLKPGTWHEVFGAEADEVFHAWTVAHYVDAVATAGKAQLDLPMSVNVALRDPIAPKGPDSYESGGPTDNVLDVWQAAAPHIDVLGPDIYQPDFAHYTAAIDHYDRAGNPLFVPETSRSYATARYMFAVLGRGGIGFSPFGMDFTADATTVDAIPPEAFDRLEPFAADYHLIAPMMRYWAKASFEGLVRGGAESDARTPDVFDFGDWIVTVHYDRSAFGATTWTNVKLRPVNPLGADGGVLIARQGPNEFIVTGRMARVEFAPKAAGRQMQFLSVNEGTLTDGSWVTHHVWNGDQTDYGLNLSAVARTLDVRLGSY